MNRPFNRISMIHMCRCGSGDFCGSSIDYLFVERDGNEIYRTVRLKFSITMAIFLTLLTRTNLLSIREWLTFENNTARVIQNSRMQHSWRDSTVFDKVNWTCALVAVAKCEFHGCVDEQ